MKRSTSLLAAAVLVVATWPISAISTQAQTVTERGLVESLAPKPKTRSLTRSVTAQPSVSTEDREFLNNLGTRGIRIDRKDREKLDEIAKKVDLPRIDIEIRFDFDSAKIRPESRPDVDALGKALSSPELAAFRIALNGHTDAKGSDEYNQRLSEDRARAVRDYLVVNFKIDPARLVPMGSGEERLKNKDDPEAAENRRVEVINLTQG